MRPERQILQALSLVATLALVSACGPLGPLSGGALSGQATPAPASWAFATDIEQMQLQTETADGEAYSINIWLGVHVDRLYVTTSLLMGAEDPLDRDWVNHVIANPRVIVRIDEALYSANLNRVTNTALAKEVVRVMQQKYDTEADARSQNAWVFEVVPI